MPYKIEDINLDDDDIKVHPLSNAIKKEMNEVKPVEKEEGSCQCEECECKEQHSMTTIKEGIVALLATVISLCLVALSIAGAIKLIILMFS